MAANNSNSDPIDPINPASTADTAETAEMYRNRRGSFGSSTFTNLFPRSHSVSGGTPVFPGSIATAAMGDQTRRRLSISTASALGLGISGPSPISAGGLGSAGGGGGRMRRGSGSTTSTLSEAADESAIEDDDGMPGGTRGPAESGFARRTSFGAQAMLNLHGPRGSFSTDQGYNWPEQFRSRAESSVVSGSRASFSHAAGLGNSPPRAGFASGHNFGLGGAGAGSGGGVGVRHDRSRSVSAVESPAAPVPPPAAPRPHHQPRKKPDAFQERILKGDFYMD